MVGRNSSHIQSSCAYTQIHGLLVMSLFWSDGDHTFLASGRAGVHVRALSCLILLICRFPDTRRVDLPSILLCLQGSIRCPAPVRQWMRALLPWSVILHPEPGPVAIVSVHKWTEMLASAPLEANGELSTIKGTGCCLSCLPYIGKLTVNSSIILK